MKRFLLFTMSILALLSISQAQITKGTVLLGGNLGTTINRSDSEPRTKYTNYTINPSLGFTVKDNYVVGFDVSFGHSNQTYQQTRDERDTYYAGVFSRRYFTLGKGFYLFGQGNAGYSLMDADRYNHQNSEGRRARQNSVGVSLYPGVAYTINKRFHLELAMERLISLNYSTGITKDYSPGFYSETKESSLNFYTSANPQSHLVVGFRMALGK